MIHCWVMEFGAHASCWLTWWSLTDCDWCYWSLLGLWDPFQNGLFMAYTCGVTNYLLGAHPASRCPQVFDDERALDLGGCFSEGTRSKARRFFHHQFFGEGVDNCEQFESVKFFAFCLLHMFAIWCDSLVKILMWSPRSFIDLQSQKPRCWAQKKNLNPALGEVPTSDFLWTTPHVRGGFFKPARWQTKHEIQLPAKGLQAKVEPVNLEVMMTAPPDLCSSLATKNKRS